MNPKTGVWVVGACGGVSTLAISGVEAIKAGLADTTALVSERPEFRPLGLARLEDLVFGGHEIREVDLVASAEEFGRADGVLTPRILEAVRPALARISKNLRPGVSLGGGPGVRSIGPRPMEKDRLRLPEIVKAIQKDLAEFRDANGLDDVVVLYLASAEPAWTPPGEFGAIDPFLELLEADRREFFPASVLYALAAIDAGCPFVNFTTCVGSCCGALDALSLRRGVPHAGRDGKTGETLMKTALAPMFVARNLRVLSWEGYNMLGNRDGKVLDDPTANRAKIQDKDAALRDIFRDDALHSRVRIDYVPSLGDWKTAWDFIHFSGFLGTRMILQFIWQGCDSALAAPLALDLVRFAEYARRRGESGILRHLACFFKAPWGVEEKGFWRQFDALQAYACARGVENAGVPALQPV
jgi:myo-inositol-1-phosphate synthase